MKPLVILRNELNEILRVKAVNRTLVAPSDYDALVHRLTSMSGQALGYGGAERILALVDAAIARGES